MIDLHQDDELPDPAEVAGLAEGAALAEAASLGTLPEPLEDSIMRLVELSKDAPTMVRIRAASALLDIAYGPVEEEEPDEDEP